MVANFRVLVINYPDMKTSILGLLTGKEQPEPPRFGHGTFKGSDGTEYSLIECSSVINQTFTFPFI